MYIIAKASTMIQVLILNAFVVEKLIFVKLIALSWSLYPWKYATDQQPIADNINTIVILWMNGISGKFPLIKIEANSDIAAATITDKEVAFFQKRATRNITTIPGEK